MLCLPIPIMRRFYAFLCFFMLGVSQFNFTVNWAQQKCFVYKIVNTARYSTFDNKKSIFCPFFAEINGQSQRMCSLLTPKLNQSFDSISSSECKVILLELIVLFYFSQLNIWIRQSLFSQLSFSSTIDLLQQ